MKRYLLWMWCALCAFQVGAQRLTMEEGKCGSDIKWTFDGYTLIVQKADENKPVVDLPDFDVKNNFPAWTKRKFAIRKVKIGDGIRRIGSCAFANCKQLETVEFYNEQYVREIGWGAFLNCENLYNFSIPVMTRKIETMAFGNCSSLRSVVIPAQAKVDDYAFLSCSNLDVIGVAYNASLGKGVFLTEEKTAEGKRYVYFDGEILSLPSDINVSNCEAKGISTASVREFLNKGTREEQTLVATSRVDSLIPQSEYTRYSTYALVIGNENYRFVPKVSFAKHDAFVFSEYCRIALGIPAQNIHLREDATKHMILEQELEGWLKTEIPNRSDKKLIVYYAGHGVPDVENKNKSYLLPTDCYGTKPQLAIALDDFYKKIGDLGFEQVTIFMDACFSGINRDHSAVNKGERATEVEAEDCNPTTGNIIVFSAAQSSETAQGIQEQGHGLFTYYLLKEIQETNGYINYGKLAYSLRKNVKDTSTTLKLNKQQTPTTHVSESLSETWKKIKL